MEVIRLDAGDDAGTLLEMSVGTRANLVKRPSKCNFQIRLGGAAETVSKLLVGF